MAHNSYTKIYFSNIIHVYDDTSLHVVVSTNDGGMLNFTTSDLESST